MSTSSYELRKYIDIITEQENNKISQLTQLWDKFAEENPNVKLALDLIPVTGIPTSAIDTAAYLDKQEYGMAALAALGMVPGIKPLMKLAAFKLTPQQLAQHNNLVKASKMAQWSDRAVDTTQYAANQSYPTTPPEMGPAP